MAYEVLARKYRPTCFADVAGQEHVLKALVHALDAGRLHHAYLFTGTRGVGKTTIARILARCLNCEQGVSANPCGTCGACEDISRGRFVDLIEVDAASRTKVEDTRDLLDNVQYAPSSGRYKVYLIDEVHMLSTSSFNALLKTLEEPPPHVKFLLATTDPKKVPVTVLSRCLQFSLKNLLPERIAGYLQQILADENIAAEESALQAISRAARGSMRDALSLTDQAIAFGEGALQTRDVVAMLGTVARGDLTGVLQALAAGDGAGLLAAADGLAQQAADFGEVLAELQGLLHEVAVAQLVPDADDHYFQDPKLARRIAAEVAPEDVQLWYQTALLGRRDLALAPDPRIGFNMVLLRMLAFRPLTSAAGLAGATVGGSAGGAKGAAGAAAAGGAAPASVQGAASAGAADSTADGDLAGEAGSPAPTTEHRPEPVSGQQTAAARTAPSSAPVPPAVEPPAPSKTNEIWHQVLPELDLGGILRSIALQCELTAHEGDHWCFTMAADAASLFSDRHPEQLAAALGEHLGRPQTVAVELGNVRAETPAERSVRQGLEAQQQAEQSIRDDVVLKELVSKFDARILPDSIRPQA